MAILAQLASVMTAILLSLLVSHGFSASNNKTVNMFGWGPLSPLSEPFQQPDVTHKGKEKCNNKDYCNRANIKSAIFIIHGFMGAHETAVNTLIKNAILAVSDVNVYIVDWSRYAQHTTYHSASAAVPGVGSVLGSLINIIISMTKWQPSAFKLIGHNLGAHIAGEAGTRVAIASGQIDYIVGLDPARPLFSSPNDLLNKDSAKFVHIIHTNYLELGIEDAIGHADYYPNGGDKQPGCYNNKTAQEILKDPVTYFSSCTHSRAYQYYAESIRKRNFFARRCSSWKRFTAGMCKSTSISHLPDIDVDRKASGVYYLHVNAKAPFSMGKNGIRARKASLKRNIKVKQYRQPSRRSIRRKVSEQRRKQSEFNM